MRSVVWEQFIRVLDATVMFFFWRVRQIEAWFRRPMRNKIVCLIGEVAPTMSLLR
jgi:hypothetical protein